MFYKNIKVGTKVRPVCENALSGVATKSLGKVIKLERSRDNREFSATIRWDNGKETSLREVFFRRTVAVIIVEEVIL